MSYLIGQIRGANITADVTNGTDANVVGAILKGMLATAEQFRWRDIANDLPADGGPKVLLAWERTEPENEGVGGVDEGYYFQERWWFQKDDDQEPIGSHIRVTHWMPVPERPPTGKALAELMNF